MIPFPRTKTRVTIATVCCPSRITASPPMEIPTKAWDNTPGTKFDRGVANILTKRGLIRQIWFVL
jgi:hypothetical protein